MFYSDYKSIRVSEYKYMSIRSLNGMLFSLIKNYFNQPSIILKCLHKKLHLQYIIIIFFF
jgi:hypothetical protein